MYAICRTCLMQVVDSTSISNYKFQLMISVPEINLQAAVNDLKICRECQISLNITYNFKIQCRETDIRLMDLQEANFNKICRTCLQQIVNTSLSVSLTEEFGYKRKLITCIPEMVLWTTTDPEMCINCCRVLDVVYKFKIQCLEFEEKIKNYFKLNGVVDLANLSELSNIIVKTEKEDYVCIKTEPKFSIKTDIDDHPLKGAIIKQEKVDLNEIKSEVVKTNKSTITKSHKCSICCYETEHKFRLNRHVLIHSLEKRFTCSACNYQTNERSIFKKHISLHAGENVFACSQCQFKTIKRSNLTRHIRLHTGEKPFECTECQFKTHDGTILKLHTLKHTGVKHFNCLKCESGIQYQSGLHNSHLKHTCKRQYQCFNCNYKINDRSTFIHHIYKHTGEKPFECVHCDYKTSIKSHLNRHIMNHTGEKRFACSECDYKTNYKWTLKSHALIHSTTELLECPQCDYKTISRNCFTKHAFVHKKEVTLKN